MMISGCLGCYDTFGIGPVIPAFAFAFAILIVLQTIGGISSCHINPAVSTGVLILGHMEWKRYLVYIVSQYAGALLGYGALWVKMLYGINLLLISIKPFSYSLTFCILI